MMIFLFFIQGAGYNLLTFPNLLGFLGIVSLIGSAIIILRSRKREEVLETTIKAVTAWEKTAGAFEKNLTAAKSDITELEEERETLKIAYTTLSGIDIKEILIWASHWHENGLLVENANLRRRNSDLMKKLAVYEPTSTLENLSG